jgi:DNA-binding beta-propeller fold protein YncE
MRLSPLFFFGIGALAQFPQLNFMPVPEWPQLPPGWNLKETAGVAVDARNHVFVLHRGDNPILEFDRNGWFVRGFGHSLFDRAHSIRVDAQGNIWTVDDGSHTVVKLDASGRVRMVFGRWRTASDAQSGQAYSGLGGAMKGDRDETHVRFKRPTDVAIGPNGDIFVSDGYGNSRVVKFSPDGRLLKIWGERGKEPGQFDTPHSILVDRQGKVYVADRENYRIQVFDGNGTFLQQWNHVGSPWGLAMSPDQHIYMADGYNNRVVKLTLEGKVVGSFGSRGKLPGQFTYAHQIAVGPDGHVYTAEILNWRAQRFVPR